MKRGRDQENRERRKLLGRTVIVVIMFLRLTSRSIFGNWENGLPYFTYVV